MLLLAHTLRVLEALTRSDAQLGCPTLSGSQGGGSLGRHNSSKGAVGAGGGPALAGAGGSWAWRAMLDCSLLPALCQVRVWGGTLRMVCVWWWRMLGQVGGWVGGWR